MTLQRYFATCARGIEPVLAGELRALGAADVAPGRGGVAFAGDQALLYQANLWLRTAVRVLRRGDSISGTATKIMSGNLSERVPVTKRNDEFDGLDHLARSVQAAGSATVQVSLSAARVRGSVSSPPRPAAR